MTLNFKNQLLLNFAVLIAIILTSCGPTPVPSSPTVPPPTSTAAPTAENHSGLFEVDRQYSDSLGDMSVSFLDVVSFRATVDEEAETLKVVLRMRDIPPEAPLGQVKNLSDYSWMISVYLDPSKTNQEDMDYYFALNTAIDEPYADTDQPIPGTPKTVPIHQIFEVRELYNSSGVSISSPEVDVNPDVNMLTITDHVPGITSSAVFSFSTDYYDGTKDEPDGIVPPASTNLSTPLPEATIPADDGTSQLIPAGNVRVYPGPEHYAGDILTFAIQPSSGFDDSTAVSMSLDKQESSEVIGTYFWFNEVILPSALDTTNLTGHHTLRFTAANGDLNETYSFNVLPADQRPSNEVSASWQLKETECCIFHYLSGTAAARDIDFIAEHFQQGANELEAVLKAEITAKMDIYLIDRLLMNGGFGGNGKLVISYTDRYYGPTMGVEGLETLARHEFSHAADIGLANAGDGVDFNYEGLAVYLAGGHYKPEPLAQRGAALYDLGYSAPVTEFIPQHELSYLHAALILTYIVETYGEEKLWEFLRADVNTPDGQLLSMEDAIRLTFGISLEEFENGFQAWLARNDPGEQLDDLRLTVKLQDARREYQDIYSPGPMFLLSEIDISAVTRPEYLPVVMREARASGNIAIELMIANAQRALIAGAYPEAEQLIQSIKEVVASGNFEGTLAKDYFEIVAAAADSGYEILSLNIQNGYATAQVTREPPITTILVLRNVNGIWQIEP